MFWWSLGPLTNAGHQDGLEIPEGALLFALHPALVDRALDRSPDPKAAEEAAGMRSA